MGYPSLLDLRNEIIGELQEYSAVLFPTAMLDRVINDAQLDIACKCLCLEDTQDYTTAANMRSVEIGGQALTTDAGVTLITDAGKILVTSDTAGVVKVLGVEYVPSTGTPTSLLPITPMQIGHNPTRTGEPEYFFRWGNYIGIDPKPATTLYLLRVYVAITPTKVMANGTDVPEIPNAFIPLIHQYGIARCFMKMRRWGTAIDVYNGYLGDCRNLRETIVMKYANRAEDILIPDRIVGQ